MNWQPWPLQDHKGIARYVTRKAAIGVRLGSNRHDLEGLPDEIPRVVEAIYNALLDKNIDYAYDDYHPSNALQVIRTPLEILKSPRIGTCIDLTTLFCGLCLANDLLPTLVVTEGHAFAAVSLEHKLREWEGYRPG